MNRMSSSVSSSIFATSCEVRKPSKKCTSGSRDRSVAAWPISAKSWASCTEALDSSEQPVCRMAMMSEWSPKIDSACVATVRAATCMQKDVSSPAILYRFGIINSRPWLAVNVVASEPACNAPWTAPMAPPSDCISMTSGTTPQTLRLPLADHSSANSPMLDDGVMG